LILNDSAGTFYTESLDNLYTENLPSKFFEAWSFVFDSGAGKLI
jgi:hypothetical protein